MTNIIHDEIIRNKVVMLCSMIQTCGYKVVVAPSFDFSGRFSNISLLNIF